MTPDEILAFVNSLPARVTRVEVRDDGYVIEMAVPMMVRAAPDIGDVEKASKAREAQRPSDVESLGHIPPEFKAE